MNARKVESDAMTGAAYTRLLDETILHLAVLEWSAGIGPTHAWRARCVALMEEFDDGLRALAVAAAQARRLRLSHTLLLDDVTVAACTREAGDEWLAASLCRVQLGEPDARELVRADLSSQIADSSASVAWLHWYRYLLTAGLFGRTPEAAAFKRKLEARLGAGGLAVSRHTGAS
ncbi:MAG: DotU family type IV/VI secretion system protein [Achromobacter sp.]|uniref:DotU family type IV/VI secretion system protein n=1 Tax=Achromobacter sp. TaxID=134375 RepID=UPI003D05F144